MPLAGHARAVIEGNAIIRSAKTTRFKMHFAVFVGDHAQRNAVKLLIEAIESSPGCAVRIGFDVQYQSELIGA